MDTQRLRQLAEQLDAVGVGGMFTTEQARELARLAIEAADALQQAPVREVVPDDVRETIEIVLRFANPATDGYRGTRIEAALDWIEAQRPATGQEDDSE